MPEDALYSPSAISPDEPSLEDGSGRKRSPFRFSGFSILAGFLFVLASLFAGAADIHDAAKAGDLEAVRRLIQADASLIHLKDGGGNLPLHAAAEGGQFLLKLVRVPRIGWRVSLN